jgi:alpha-1,4-galacturonosyltransferase
MIACLSVDFMKRKTMRSSDLGMKGLNKSIFDLKSGEICSSLQKMRGMEATLLKASHVFPDCSDMAMKLRSMTHNTEELVQSQRNQAAHLVRLAARTTPKGLHCLSMRLTADYFALQPEERLLPNQQKLQDTELYHYAVFSDNVLACAVVVNSTISTAMVNCLRFSGTKIFLVLIYQAIIFCIAERTI